MWLDAKGERAWDLTYTYDRLGRRTTIVQGSTTTTRLFDLAGRLLSESYTGGPLNGLTVSNVYDNLLRRATNGLWNGTGWIIQTHYTYDPDTGRLATVSDGAGHTASYSYLANSELVEQSALTENGQARMGTVKTYDALNGTPCFRRATLLRRPDFLFAPVG